MTNTHIRAKNIAHAPPPPFVFDKSVAHSALGKHERFVYDPIVRRLRTSPVKDELLQRIHKAYAGIPRPTRITKRVAEALDDEWVFSEERWAELYALDTEQQWTDLTDADIEQFCFILPWLDDESLRFYLPAFMCYCLRRFPDEGHRAVCDAQDACASPDRKSVFSQEQLACVHAFSELYLSKDASHESTVA